MAEKKKYSTFAVMFYINKAKAKKNGMCTIMGRISVSGEMTQFSTKIDIAPAQWDVKKYRIKGKTKEVNEINHRLDAITKDIELHHRELVETQNYVTAEQLKNRVCNIGQKKNTILALFEEHNEDYSKMVGVTRTQRSYNNYKLVLRHFTDFIMEIYGEDLMLSQMNLSVIERYELFLHGRKGFGVSTVNGNMIALSRVVKRGLHQGIIKKDPFVGYKFKTKPHKYRHMSSEDLEKMMHTSIKSKAICFARDMFVFSTFTGLSFVDLYNLRTNNLHQRDGFMWIETKRQKTGSDCYIPLLEIPRKIIAKYEGVRKGDRIFNMVTSSTMQENLAKVLKLSEIDNHTSYHCARHNFGTLITLLNDVPLETVSKMMGHSDLKTTEIYAHLTSQKVANDMRELSNGISGKYELFEDKDMPVVAEYNYFEFRDRYEKRYNNN